MKTSEIATIGDMQYNVIVSIYQHNIYGTFSFSASIEQREKGKRKWGPYKINYSEAKENNLFRDNTTQFDDKKKNDYIFKKHPELKDAYNKALDKMASKFLSYVEDNKLKTQT